MFLFKFERDTRLREGREGDATLSSIHLRAGLLSRETSASWRNGPTETSWNSARVKAKSFTWERRTANNSSGDLQAGKQLHWKLPGVPGGWGGLAAWEQAMYLGNREGQQHPGHYLQEQSYDYLIFYYLILFILISYHVFVFIINESIDCYHLCYCPFYRFLLLQLWANFLSFWGQTRICVKCVAPFQHVDWKLGILHMKLLPFSQKSFLLF